MIALYIECPFAPHSNPIGKLNYFQEIAFKKSLEDAVASGTFSALFGGVNVQNQILAKLQAADIHILHDMGEKNFFLKSTLTTDRSSSLMQSSWFKNDAPHQLADVADYVNYLLTWGLPPVAESDHAQNVQTALGPYIKGQAPYVELLCSLHSI